MSILQETIDKNKKIKLYIIRKGKGKKQSTKEFNCITQLDLNEYKPFRMKTITTHSDHITIKIIDKS